MQRLRLYVTLIATLVLSSLTLSAKGLCELRVVCTNDWIYTDEAFFNIMLTAGESGASGSVVFRVDTDKGEELQSLVRSYAIAAGEPCQLQFIVDDLEPGFYRATVYDDGVVSKKFNFGVRPDDIVSPNDAEADIWEFWAEGLEQLAAVDPEYKLTHEPKLSGSLRDLYLVEMKSWGGETIRGYWAVPKAPGKYPTVVTFMGYGAHPWTPSGNHRGDRAEFILSVRGQALNEPYNTYGDWMCYQLGNKDSYYYRGAILDTIRAIDFVLSQPECDSRCVLLEGGSQGGALALAAASLDNRVAGAAPHVPFLSDYPDYFEINKAWPGNAFLGQAKRIRLSNEALFKMLSYFDLKNLTDHIECPVLMGFGLQDEICPPHTNFAGYNAVRTPKRWIVSAERGHNMGTDPRWIEGKERFFKEIMANTFK